MTAAVSLPVAEPGSEPPLPTGSGRTAVAFGGQVDPAEPDPLVWQELRGLGPALSRRVAQAAAAGELVRPHDLLRVHGIGPKMTALIAPRVAWRSPGGASEQQRQP